MCYRIFAAILFSIIIVNPLDAQITQSWLQRFNGTGNLEDEGHAITTDLQNNIYVAGASTGTGTSLDITTIKYNSSGNLQWSQTYNGSQNDTDEAKAIKVDASGNVYLTGYTKGVGTGRDFVIIKYNSSGIQQWAQTYNGTGSDKDVATSIDVDGSGNVYVAGYSFGILATFDGATLKCNASGVIQWVQRYNGSANGYDELVSVAVDGSSNVYVTGASTEVVTGQDCITIKYNTDGVQQWSQKFSGTDNLSDRGSFIKIDSNGDVYVAGNTYRINSYTDYLLIKYNANGVQQWTDFYNGDWNGEDQATALLADQSGIYITGLNIEGNWTFFRSTTIKYNFSGTREWVQRYVGESRQLFLSMAVDVFGNVYVCGASHTLATLYDYITIKYNSAGVEQWIQKYDGDSSGDDYAASITVDLSGNIYVTGESLGLNTGGDIVTIQYSQITGIQNSGEVPGDYSLGQNYPNPFNPVTVINYSIKSNVRRRVPSGSTSDVKLIVYDALGRAVSILVNENKLPGNYEVEFDGSNIPSGSYYYRLEVDGEIIDTKSMVLLK